MNKKTLTIVLITILIVLIGYFVWKNKNSNQNGNNIKLGVIMPLTGPVAEPGTNALNGVKIAIDRFNEENNGKTIDLIIEDSKSSPKDGVSSIQKLINIDKVKIIIGDLMSSVFLAIAPIAESNKITMISPGASNPEVKNAGNYIFRNYPSDDYDGEVMAKYIYNKLNKKTTVIIFVNNDYGNGVAGRFEQVFSSIGGQTLEKISYQEGQTDFKTIVTKTKNINPEIIYIVGNPNENGQLTNEIKVQNLKIPLSGNLSFENESFLKIAKGSFDSIVYSSPYFNLEKTDDYTQFFLKSYEQKYSKKPDIAAALGYDVAMILIQALKNVNYNMDKINDELYKIKNFEGITGTTSFDEFGDVKKSIFIKSINSTGEVKTIDLYKP